MKRCLVIGMGSAGQRHATLLEKLGYSVVSFDPDPRRNATTNDPDVLFSDYLERVLDFVVVATPPDQHRFYIETSLVQGLKVVCEKPLFGFEYDENMTNLYGIENVAVTYNYRYHPTLLDSITYGKRLPPERDWWYLQCGQHRISSPSWGYVLDHISHDIDILMWLSGTKSANDVIVESAWDDDDRGVERLLVSGKIGTYKFEINEMIYKSPMRRFASINTPWGWFEIDGNPLMFINMWKSIISSFENDKPPYPNFFDAYETQKVLYKIQKEIENV